MKIRISATIDEKTDKMINFLVRDGKYRNKSHVIEKAVQELLEKKDEKNKK